MDATRPVPVAARRRRWLVALAISAVLAALYAVAVGWVARRVESDIAKSIRPLPEVIEDHQHRAN